MTYSYMENLSNIIWLPGGESNGDLNIAVSSDFTIHRRNFNASSSLDVVEENPEAEGYSLSVLDEELLGDPLIELDLFKV